MAVQASDLGQPAVRGSPVAREVAARQEPLGKGAGSGQGLEDPAYRLTPLSVASAAAIRLRLLAQLQQVHPEDVGDTLLEAWLGAGSQSEKLCGQPQPAQLLGPPTALGSGVLALPGRAVGSIQDRLEHGATKGLDMALTLY